MTLVLGCMFPPIGAALGGSVIPVLAGVANVYDSMSVWVGVAALMSVIIFGLLHFRRNTCRTGITCLVETTKSLTKRALPPPPQLAPRISFPEEEEESCAYHDQHHGSQKIEQPEVVIVKPRVEGKCAHMLSNCKQPRRCKNDAKFIRADGAQVCSTHNK